MSLTDYRRKRRFAETPEPTGGIASKNGPLRFVVQKHHASHLHYDFRLEVDGALKSWAVPKGPSLDPTQKRLAMQVEDHPLDYRSFEGTIPAGNYGAGTVMVWDEGFVRSEDGADRKTSEQALRSGIEKGRLSFVLEGSKLAGEFSLVRLPRGGRNSWLLIKKSDEAAGDDDVLAQDRSAVSGRSLEEIAAGKPLKKAAAKAKTTRRRPTRESSVAELPKERGGNFVKPMLATLVDEPFDREGWIFEIKWDGYRAIAESSKRSVRLYSRNQKSFETRFAPIVESLKSLKEKAVIDGEIVVLDEDGRSSFQGLQNYQKTGQGTLRFVAFDLLSLGGKNLRKKPLVERKAALAELIKGVPQLMMSDHVEVTGKAFFEAARKRNLEGVIAKDGASLYREGERSGDWLKIKTHLRQEAVIGGFTAPRGSRVGIGALVLGVYDDRSLVYIGHTGGGFDSAGLASIRSRLEKLVRKTCPFAEEPAVNAPVQWVSPKLACEVRFQEWTTDGRMRQPIFLGLREDKEASAVRREQPMDAERTVMPARKKQTKARPRTAKATAVGEPALTNLDKLYWPDDGFTKGDAIAYYREVSEVILPYLIDRPESLHRHPNGINRPSFFQKDVGKQPPPDFVDTIDLHSESTNETIKYLLCQNQASLLYLANLGCIELNPWHSRTESLDRPDYLLMDLDPQGQPFDEVVRTAQTVRRILEDAGASCWCKTSGKRGLHITVPLAARYEYEQVRQFAELVANFVHEKLPETTSIVRSPAKRRERIYLDYLQNARGQTVAAPYSIRPAPGATVSTPLRWSEVKKGLDPTKFTIKTMPKRIAKFGDLWKGVLGKGADLGKLLAKLSNPATGDGRRSVRKR
jgi:bifunctional non-homologous end joining protein LigD